MEPIGIINLVGKHFSIRQNLIYPKGIKPSMRKEKTIGHDSALASDSGSHSFFNKTGGYKSNIKGISSR